MLQTVKKPGTQKLSELARHLVMPTGIVSTEYPRVETKLRQLRVPMDEWQRGIGRALLAKRADGLYACGIGGAVLSIPRQTGKTYGIGWIVFALCLLKPDTLVIWTAHRTRTSDETFHSMDGMASRPSVAPYIEKTTKGNGKQAIEFANGSRILFGAREQGFGRGFAKVDILVFDEAQILTTAAMEDMVPATNAAPNGLVLFMGTPPRPKDPGAVFQNRRDSALDGSDPDVLFVEFSAEENANPFDRKQWRIANPSYPHRTGEAAILRMLKLLGSLESFKREGLGIWDKKIDGAKAFAEADFLARKIELDMAPREGVKVFGVKFAVDATSVALAVAMRPDGGIIHMQGIRMAPLSQGTQWLVDYLKDRIETTAQIVIDGKAGAGHLIQALRDENISAKVILTPSPDQVITAHTSLSGMVTSAGVTFYGEELERQANIALKRKIGTTGGYGWDAPDGDTVVLLEAATLATWGAKITKRRPGRRAKFL